MKRLTCGAFVQLFLNFLMATLLSMVELVFSFCRISRYRHIFPSLSWFFLSCTQIVLIYVPDCCLSIQRLGCPLMSFINMTSWKFRKWRDKKPARSEAKLHLDSLLSLNIHFTSFQD